jgi:hypothetical protein
MHSDLSISSINSSTLSKKGNSPVISDLHSQTQSSSHQAKNHRVSFRGWKHLHPYRPKKMTERTMGIGFENE